MTFSQVIFVQSKIYFSFNWLLLKGRKLKAFCNLSNLKRSRLLLIFCYVNFSYWETYELVAFMVVAT